MKLWWLVALVGCEHPSQHSSDAALDAPVVVEACDAAIGYATVTVNGTAHTFSRVYAGGQQDPLYSQMSLLLMFTDGDQSLDTLQHCCAYEASTCCGLDGAKVHSVISAVGDYTVGVTSLQDPTPSAQGPMTITDLIDPLISHTYGRIAGSITATGANDSVDAMFDTTFCFFTITD